MPLLRRGGAETLTRSSRPGTDFFADAVDEVLGPWLRDRGFVDLAAYSSRTMVAYQRGRTFMRFSFWPTDAPDFLIMAGLGSLREGWGLFGPRKPLLSGLGLWETIEDEESRAFLRRPFHDRDELVGLLEQVREVALPVAEPLLADAVALRNAIKRRKS